MLLVASREGIGALERAKKHGIDSAVFDKKKFASDEEMFSAIGDELVRRGTELIVLAGYLNILPPRFVERFAKKSSTFIRRLFPNTAETDFTA